jgi:hypothetical protein
MVFGEDENIILQWYIIIQNILKINRFLKIRVSEGERRWETKTKKREGS